MTHPYLAALGIGYILKESGLNPQDLFNEMFNLGPRKFDEPVGVVDETLPETGGGPEDVPGGPGDQQFACLNAGGQWVPGLGCLFTKPPNGTDEIIEEPGTGADIPPEMEEVLETAEDTQLLPGAIQGAIIEQEPTVAGLAGQLTTVFPSGTEEAVEAAVASLTAADLRARRRVTVSPVEVIPEEIPEPTVSSSAQEAGLETQIGFIDGVEIGGEFFQIP